MTNKIKPIVFTLIALIFIAAINTTCKKKELKCDEVIVVGGITGELIGPEWLVLRINEILANTHERGFTPAIMVYSGTYDGSEYIFIECWPVSLTALWELLHVEGYLFLLMGTEILFGANSRVHTV